MVFKLHLVLPLGHIKEADDTIDVSRGSKLAIGRPGGTVNKLLIGGKLIDYLQTLGVNRSEAELSSKDL